MPEIFVFDKTEEYKRWVAEVDAKLTGTERAVLSISKTAVDNFDTHACDSVPNKPGIYLIWVNEIIKYIGKDDDLRDRIKQHSVSRPTTTHTKRAKVKEALDNNLPIYFTYVRVEPLDLRAALESSLQRKYKPEWCDRID